MKFLFKLALLPVLIAIWVCWIIAAIASRIYGLTHGFLWAVLLVPIVIACVLQMWQNALVFLAVGAASYLILFAFTFVEVLLETLRDSIRMVITA